MKVTEIWIRIFILFYFISRTLSFPPFVPNAFGLSSFFGVIVVAVVAVVGEWPALSFDRFKMPVLPAEQIGSGRWFNDCFWHPAIPLLHWISNIQLCASHCASTIYREWKNVLLYFASCWIERACQCMRWFECACAYLCVCV